MAIAAIVRFDFREDALDAVPALIDEVLATTRTFAGLERLDILLDPANPGLWTLYEIWADEASEAAYRTFRATPEGSIAALGELLAGAPTLEHYTVRE